jgi:Lamin Tail Domain
MAPANELFALSASTPEGALVRGRGMVGGGAGAQAYFRRGFRLGAQAALDAAADVAIGEELSASLRAGLSARSGLALEAALPLDLFDEAGMVARLQAQAEVSGTAALTLSIGLDELKRLAAAHSSRPIAELLDVFFEEFAIGAGVWGRAAFSAEIVGEALVAGSLLPGADGGAGFSASVEWGAGFGFGAGAEFVTNFGLQDPRRFVERMSETITARTLAEAEAFMGGLAESERQAARPALAMLRTILPVASRMAFQLGLDLRSTALGAQRERAAATAVEAFVSRAQQMLLDALLEIALQALADVLGRNSIVARIADMTPRQRARALEAAISLRERIEAFAQLSLAAPQAWIDALLAALAAIDDLADAGLLPPDVEAEVGEALGMAWACGTLADRALTWFADPNRAVASIFDPALQVPGAARFRRRVNVALGRGPDAAVGLPDLIAFLADVDVIAELRDAAPEVADALDWVREALETPAGNIVQRLLVDLAQPDGDAALELLDALANAVRVAVADQIGPRLLDPIKENDPQLRPLIDEILLPLLAGLPGTVLPAIPNLGDEDAALRMRETISALLLQPVARFLVTTADILLERALRDGAQVLRGLATDIDQRQRTSPALSGIVVAASRAALPFAITLEDLEQLLRLAADVFAQLDDEREPLMDALLLVLTLGLGADASRQATLEALSEPGRAWPHAGELETALARVGDGAKNTAQLVIPRAFELIALHFVRLVTALAEAVYQGAKAVFEAAKWAVEHLGALLVDVAATLEELTRRIAGLLADALADLRALSNHLVRLAGAVVDDIRAAGFALIEPLIAGLPEGVQEAVRVLYNAAFDAIRWLITAPLQALSSVSGWAEDAIRAGLERASYDEQLVREDVRQQMLRSGAGDLHFDLKLEAWGVTIVDLGRITIPGSVQLEAAAKRTLADPVFQSTLHSAAARSLSAQEAMAQKRVVEQYRDSTDAEQEAAQRVLDLAPGDAIGIAIEQPQESQVLGLEGTLRVRIDGANMSFVEETLGVPKRVTLRLNGREIRYRVADWREQAGGIVFEARVVSSAEPQLAEPPYAALPPRALRRIELYTDVAALVDTVRADGDADAVGAPEPALLERVSADLEGTAATAQESDRITGVATIHAGPTITAPPRPRTVDFIEVPVRDPMPLEAVSSDALTGFFGLNVLEVAVSDGVRPGEGDKRLFSMGGGVPPTVSGVEIEDVIYDPVGRDVEGEHVVVLNGTSQPVELEGWTLRDLARHVHRFEKRTVPAGATVRVWTGQGTDDEENAYLGRGAAIWNNAGDSAILRDADDREVSRYTYLGASRS